MSAMNTFLFFLAITLQIFNALPHFNTLSIPNYIKGYPGLRKFVDRQGQCALPQALYLNFILYIELKKVLFRKLIRTKGIMIFPK